MRELDFFRHVAGDNLFKQWIEAEKAASLKVLALGEGTALHRAQGRYQLLLEIESRLEQAKGLR